MHCKISILNYKVIFILIKRLSSHSDKQALPQKSQKQDCTIKLFKYIFIGLSALLILVAALVQSLKLDVVQRRIAKVVSNEIEASYGIPVEIEKIEINNLTEITLRNIQIVGLDGNNIINTDEAIAHISPLKLLDNELCINTLIFAAPDISLNRDSANAPLNIQFILDNIAERRKKQTKSKFNVRINQALVYDGRFRYDIGNEPEKYGVFDPNHVDIDKFQCNISLKQFSPENIRLNIRSISGKEKSGLEIIRLCANVESEAGQTRLKRFEFILPGSTITSDILDIYYDPSNPAALSLQGELKGERISPADFAPLFPKMANGTPAISLNIKGRTDSTIAEGYIDIQTHNNSFIFKGNCAIDNPYKSERTSRFAIEQLTISEENINRLLSYIGNDSERISRVAGDIRFTGDAEVSEAGLLCNGDFKSRSGDIYASISLDSVGKYAALIKGKRVLLAAISGNEKLKSCDITANISGNISDRKSTALLDAEIENLEFNGYRYSAIEINGVLNGKDITADITSDDPNLKADINISHSTTKGKGSHLDIALTKFNPYNLNLTRDYNGEEFSMNLKYDHIASENGERTTSIRIEDFLHYDGENENVLHNLYITDSNTSGHRTLVLNSDFMEGNITGEFDLGGIRSTFYNVIETHLPSLGIKSSKLTRGGKNNFTYKLEVWNTDFLSKITDLPMTVEKQLEISGKCNDRIDHLTMNAKLEKVFIGKGIYREINIESESNADIFYFDATIQKPIIKNRKTFDYNNTENDITIKLNSTIDEDIIKNNIAWFSSGKEKNMQGKLRMDASIATDQRGKPNIVARIYKDSIRHYGNIWYTSEGTITGNTDALTLKDIRLYNDMQSLSIEGVAGRESKDTLNLHAEAFEVSVLLDLYNFRWIKIAGKTTGDACLTSALSAPDLNGNFRTDTLSLDGARVGRADVNIGWSNERKEIYLNGEVHNDANELSTVYGFFSQPNDTIDLMINGKNLNAAFLNERLKAFLDNINGTASGSVHLKGHWNNIDLFGGLALNASTRVKSTNVTYWFRGDSMKFSKGLIRLDNADIYDRYGNHGILSGTMKHKNMSKWDCELNIKTDHMLVYDTHDYGIYPIYGTIFASGDAKLTSKGKSMRLDADLTTKPGSRFVYNSTERGGVRDNSFITFTDSNKDKHSYNIPAASKEEYKDISSKLHLDFMLDVTDGFGLKVFTNTKTDDYIDLYGNGKIRAIYDEKEGFTMNGKLDLERGTYKFTIQDIFPKEFSIDKGSSILFQGDPFNARLDLRTKHLIPSASLGDLTTETSKRKTVKVNCLMHITNTLQSPALNFDLELPEGSEEERELLASVANTQEQKNMQFIYLLGIGKFYTFDQNSGDGYMQSSTAMESLISNTLSGQLNNMLGQIIDNGNWDFSGNFSTSEKGWNRMEVEGMLEGRLLDNRLLINGNFGYRDNPIANRSFIGDFEIQWLLTPKGTVSLKAYSKTNDRYFSKTNLTTQGGGITFRFDFDRFLPTKKKKKDDKDESNVKDEDDAKSDTGLKNSYK